jgi:hypothetical protein
MKPEASLPRRRSGSGSLALLLAVVGLLGYVARGPADLGVAVAVIGVGAGGLLQRVPRSSSIRSLAPVPVVLSVVTVAAASPLGAVPELLGGVAGLAVLVWLADDLDRPAGGIGRATSTLGISAAGVGIAWASAVLLPSRSSASLGIAAGLLVFVVVAIAYLVGQPSAFDREEASSS